MNTEEDNKASGKKTESAPRKGVSPIMMLIIIILILLGVIGSCVKY